MPTRGKKANKSSAASQKNDLDIGSLVQKIANNPDNCHLQICSMLLLLEILSAPERPEFDALKATKVLILSIKTYPQQPELQRCACNCLWCIAQGSPASLKLVRTPEVLAAVKENIINHPCDIQVLYASLRIMVGMFLDPRNCNDSLRKHATESGIIKNIFELLDVYMENSDIQYLGMTVSLLVWKTVTTAQIATKDALSTTLKAMQAHSKNLHVQLSCCSLILHIISNDVESVDEAWKQGVMKDVLRALDACLYSDSSTFQQYVTKYIGVSYQSDKDDERSQILRCLRIIDQMYECGSEPRVEADLHVIAAAMAKYLQDAALQEIGINAIWKVMRRLEAAENIKHLGQQGIRAVLSSMVTLQKHQAAQLVAFECLNMFLDYSPSNSTVMIQNNALSVVIRSMKLHQKSLFMNLCGIRFFCLMSRDLDPPGKDALVKTGCFGAVAAAIRLDDDDDKKRSLAAYGCACIRNMLSPDFSDDVRKQIVREDFFPAILHAMDACQDNEEAQTNGVYAMHMVCSNNMTHATRYFNDMIPRVVFAMRVCSQDEYLHLLACDTIGQMFEYVASHDMGFPAFQNRFASHQGPDAVICCARMHRGLHGAEVAAQACRVLYHAAYDHDINRRYLINHNILTVLTEIMELHKNDPSVLETATMAYAMITRPCNSDTSQNTSADSGSDGVPHHSINSALPRESKGQNRTFGVAIHGAHVCTEAAVTGIPVQNNVKNCGTINCLDNDCCDGLQNANTKTSYVGNTETLKSGEVKPCDDLASMKQQDLWMSNGACQACGKTSEDVGMKQLLKCSACTLATRYCSAACQKACWGAHKAECKANRKACK
jgi:hypothetical protein